MHLNMMSADNIQWPIAVVRLTGVQKPILYVYIIKWPNILIRTCFKRIRIAYAMRQIEMSEQTNERMNGKKNGVHTSQPDIQTNEHW